MERAGLQFCDSGNTWSDYYDFGNTWSFLHQIPLMSFDSKCSLALLYVAVVCLQRVIVVFPDNALTFLVMLSNDGN